MSPKSGSLLAVCIIALLVFVLLSTRVAKAVLLAGAFALLFLLGWSINWDSPITPLALLKLTGLCLCLCFILWFIRREWRIWKGLDQWLNPKGRYYDRWLALPGEDNSDYYPWLAEQKGWQEPWASWARMDKETDPLAPSFCRVYKKGIRSPVVPTIRST
jgi:hypothetical protein